MVLQRQRLTAVLAGKVSVPVLVLNPLALNMFTALFTTTPLFPVLLLSTVVAGDLGAIM
jgi:hypothetical protein